MALGLPHEQVWIAHGSLHGVDENPKVTSLANFSLRRVNYRNSYGKQMDIPTIYWWFTHTIYDEIGDVLLLPSYNID